MDDSGLKELIAYSAQYVWLMVIALWGGTASYISRVKRGERPFSVIELIGEWFVSGFAGVMCMYICMYLEMSTPITAAATGIAGHMGGRAIFLIEQWVVEKTDLLTGMKKRD